MPDLGNENIIDSKNEILDKLCTDLLMMCKYVYHEYGKKSLFYEDYIDDEMETEMANWLLYEVLRSKPTVNTQREYVSQEQFFEDFCDFDAFIRNIIPESKELKQLIFLIRQIESVQKIPFLKSRIERFYKHYIDEKMQMDKESEILYIVLFSIWLYKTDEMDQTMQKLQAELFDVRKKSIENGKNNFTILSTLIMTVKCCAELYFMEENEFIFTRYGIQLFLGRFRFTENMVKVELLNTLITEWEEPGQYLNAIDPGALIIRLNLFMEEQGKPILGKWSKEQKERYLGVGKFMSGDTRPLMQLVRAYFGNGVEKIITDAYFNRIKHIDALNNKNENSQSKVEQDYQGLYFNRFVAAVFLLLNPKPDSFFAVSELRCLLLFLFNWMEDKDEDSIIKMILYKKNEANQLIAVSEKITNDAIDLIKKCIAETKIEFDGNEYEELMTAILFRQFQVTEINPIIYKMLPEC